jgi:YVTN family beta-propeller protein
MIGENHRVKWEALMNALRLSLALSVAAFAFVSQPKAAEQTNYKIIDRIKVPDGAFDYATYEPSSGRIYMPRADNTTVIDPKTGKVSEFKSASRGHIALPLPGSTLIVLTQRQGTIRIVDTATDKVVADFVAGKNPDGATYDPFSKLVFVMNHDGGDSTVVDPATKKPVATINVGGELEFPVSDGAGKVFVNIASTGEIGVIDVKARKLTAKYKMAGCMDPSGLAYIPDSKLLVSACDNQMAKVLQADTGKEVASLKIGGGPDAVIYDARRKLAFIPSGDEGVLEVISLADPAHISVIQHVPTQKGTRTGTLDPTTGRLYMMAFKSGPATGGGRAPRLPGSFEVLVVGPQ